MSSLMIKQILPYILSILLAGSTGPAAAIIEKLQPEMVSYGVVMNTDGSFEMWVQTPNEPDFVEPPTVVPVEAPDTQHVELPTVVPVEAPGTVPSAEEYPLLERGDSGEAVERLQLRLTELGYYNSKITCKMDSPTQLAYKKFEKANGFVANGVASPEEQAVLYSEAAVAAQ